MAEQDKYIIKIELNDDGATATLKGFNDKVISSKVNVSDLRKELGNFVVSANKTKNSLKLTEKELQSLEKRVGGFKSATGAASSAALELGRVVSDAPYGIRGMANNVSQLASQITFMATAVDNATGKTLGWRGAFRKLGKSLMGTTGVLLAIQVVIAAIDYFANRTSKAEEELNKFNDSMELMRVKLDLVSKDLPTLSDDIETLLGILKECSLSCYVLQ